MNEVEYIKSWGFLGRVYKKTVREAVDIKNRIVETVGHGTQVE